MKIVLKDKIEMKRCSGAKFDAVGLIRECGSTLYVAMATQLHPPIQTSRLQKALYEDLPVKFEVYHNFSWPQFHGGSQFLATAKNLHFLLPARASEQGNVIGSVRLYIYICVYKKIL